MLPFHVAQHYNLRYAPGCISELPDRIAALKVGQATIALITDRGVLAAGVVEPIVEQLSRSYHVEIFSNIEGEPTTECVDRAADFLRQIDTACIMGVGGGSALDVAKVLRSLSTGRYSIEHYALAAQPMPAGSIPTILVPTTAGTGSEMTRTAIFTNRQGRKTWIYDDQLRPEMIFLDPQLTLKLPAHITAATGLDVIVHAIEACTNKRRNSWIEAYSLQAIRLAYRSLQKAIDSPHDLEARGTMLLAAAFAGVAIDNCGTGVAHAIGHALGALCKMAHGHAVAIGLDATLAWSVAGHPEIYHAIAATLNIAPEQIGMVFHELLMKTGLALSVPKKISAEQLAEAIMWPENMSMVASNSREITYQDVLHFAREIIGG